MTQQPPHSRTYLVEATLMVVFILGPAVWLAFALDAKSGSIADWVAALATVAAFIAAVAAARYAKGALDREEKRDADRLEAAKRAQAELVAGWHHDPAVKIDTNDRSLFPGWRARRQLDFGLSHALPDGHDDIQVAVRNASDLPVTAVVVQVFVPYQVPTTIKIPVLPPDASPRIFTVPTQATSASVGLAMGISLARLGADRDSVTVAMSFADAAGRTWIRDQNGTLTAVSA